MKKNYDVHGICVKLKNYYKTMLSNDYYDVNKIKTAIKYSFFQCLLRPKITSSEIYSFFYYLSSEIEIRPTVITAFMSENHITKNKNTNPTVISAYESKIFMKKFYVTTRQNLCYFDFSKYATLDLLNLLRHVTSARITTHMGLLQPLKLHNLDFKIFTCIAG